MFKPLAAATAIAALISAAPALAGEAADITTKNLYAGTLQAGLDELAPLTAAGDQEAKFGAGFITFVKAIEGFAQALYRHGLAAPETGPLGPTMSVPVPPNPNPEPLDYQKVRAILGDLVSMLDAADVLLEAAGQSGDYVVPIDTLKVKIDFDGDGAAEANETIEQVFATAFGTPRPGEPVVAPETTVPAEEPAPDKKGKADKAGKTAAAPPVEPTAPSEPVSQSTIGFDRADAIWLAGYSNVFAAQADFLLAHDFEDFVNASFHRIFPRAKLPMQDYATGGMLMLDPTTDTAIADAIAAIHTINWPVVEPERLAGVLKRFQKITALSRANWDAIEAETDDNRELVPNTKQTPLVPEGKVTAETIAAWRATLDTADQILAGELLVPHWRFKQGFDLNAYFNTAKRFDLVMMIDGYDALPFLKDGPIATAASFGEANRVFGDQFLGYIFWFN